jgi:hypothetical protein
MQPGCYGEIGHASKDKVHLLSNMCPERSLLLNTGFSRGERAGTCKALRKHAWGAIGPKPPGTFFGVAHYTGAQTPQAAKAVAIRRSPEPAFTHGAEQLHGWVSEILLG